LARARAAAGKLAAKLNAAQENGGMKYFNRAYHAYRVEAQRRGKTFMPYSVALGRLRKLLAGAAAGHQLVDLVAVVFSYLPPATPCKRE
jgi:hypothetical protein